jgi:hypothetical protein
LIHRSNSKHLAWAVNWLYSSSYTDQRAHTRSYLIIIGLTKLHFRDIQANLREITDTDASFRSIEREFYENFRGRVKAKITFRTLLEFLCTATEGVHWKDVRNGMHNQL